jgi:hypothetical protein
MHRPGLAVGNRKARRPERERPPANRQGRADADDERERGEGAASLNEAFI